MAMNIVWCFLILLKGIVCDQVLAHLRECNPDYETACDDGHCVQIMQWCDTIVDCPDRSDELHCHEVKPCSELEFPCRNGNCISLLLACDGYDDCGDFSDEEVCPPSTVEVPDTLLQMDSSATIRGDAKAAVARAAEYLMGKRNKNNDWDSFTSRAVVAMAFASRVVPVAEEELMKKQLNVGLLLDLMQNQNTTRSSSLALYINALYATCQDPFNFQGVDLVARLRSETDNAISSNSSIPLAFLTLCIAGQMTENDARTLYNMYSQEEFQRTSSRVLIVMGMICYDKYHRNVFRHTRQHFFTYRPRPHVADVYSKALFMQAAIATGQPRPLEELVREQLPDGSFGDMLATYYAIPVLMNSSLLDLKCNGTINTEMGNAPLKGNGENHVIYSLWISNGNDVNSHSLTITFDGQKNFFEVMLIAALRDRLFEFLYDEVDNGKRVYSIAGIPNDAESGKSWTLYKGKANRVQVNTVENLPLQPIDVAKINAVNEDHFVFWFKRDL